MSGLSCSKSSRINPEDYDNAYEIQMDPVGVYNHFKEQQTDLYEIMLEILQNAIDSTELDKPNKITVEIGRHPVANPDTEPVLRVTDEGEGITRLHDFDIYKWISALKAKSEKAHLERALGSKGIGMLQFPNIGDRILITSMYKGLIVRVFMFENDRGMLAFSVPKMILQATQEDRDYYGMNHDGTKLEFFHRPQDLGWPQGRAISNFIKSVQEEYAIRFAENPDLTIMIGKKKVEQPEWIKDHLPEVLWTNKNGHEVRGSIWGDDKSTGIIKMYRGHRITAATPLLTQCTGYFENWDLKTSAPRTSFIENAEWNDTIKHLKAIMSRFPPVGQQTDEKEFKAAHDYMMQALNPPKVPTAFGGQKDLTKDENTGDRDGNDTTGYAESKELDPNRKIKRRKKHKRDNKNQNKVGSEGEDPIKKTSQKTKSSRSEHKDIDEGKHDYGPKKPLTFLFKELVPWLMMWNTGNAEYEIHKKMNSKDPRAYRASLNNWIAEAEAQADKKVTEEYRMEMSNRRVIHWKNIGYYPKTAAEKQALDEALSMVVREDEE